MKRLVFDHSLFILDLLQLLCLETMTIKQCADAALEWVARNWSFLSRRFDMLMFWHGSEVVGVFFVVSLAAILLFCIAVVEKRKATEEMMRAINQAQQARAERDVATNRDQQLRSERDEARQSLLLLSTALSEPQRVEISSGGRGGGAVYCGKRHLIVSFTDIGRMDENGWKSEGITCVTRLKDRDHGDTFLFRGFSCLGTSPIYDGEKYVFCPGGNKLNCFDLDTLQEGPELASCPEDVCQYMWFCGGCFNHGKVYLCGRNMVSHSNRYGKRSKMMEGGSFLLIYDAEKGTWESKRDISLPEKCRLLSNPNDSEHIYCLSKASSSQEGEYCCCLCELRRIALSDNTSSVISTKRVRTKANSGFDDLNECLLLPLTNLDFIIIALLPGEFFHMYLSFSNTWIQMDSFFPRIHNWMPHTEHYNVPVYSTARRTYDSIFHNYLLWAPDLQAFFLNGMTVKLPQQSRSSFVMYPLFFLPKEDFKKPKVKFDVHSISALIPSLRCQGTKITTGFGTREGGAIYDSKRRIIVSFTDEGGTIYNLRQGTMRMETKKRIYVTRLRDADHGNTFFFNNDSWLSNSVPIYDGEKYVFYFGNDRNLHCLDLDTFQEGPKLAALPKDIHVEPFCVSCFHQGKIYVNGDNRLLIYDTDKNTWEYNREISIPPNSRLLSNPKDLDHIYCLYGGNRPCGWEIYDDGLRRQGQQRQECVEFVLCCIDLTRNTSSVLSKSKMNCSAPKGCLFNDCLLVPLDHSEFMIVAVLPEMKWHIFFSKTGSWIPLGTFFSVSPGFIDSGTREFYNGMRLVKVEAYRPVVHNYIVFAHDLKVFLRQHSLSATATSIKLF